MTEVALCSVGAVQDGERDSALLHVVRAVLRFGHTSKAYTTSPRKPPTVARSRISLVVFTFWRVLCPFRTYVLPGNAGGATILVDSAGIGSTLERDIRSTITY